MSNYPDFSQTKPIIDWLAYRSYEQQRKLNPHVNPLRWRAIYRDATVFEDIFKENIDTIYGGPHGKH